ncbi:hypothetical protein MKUB_23590 [Mycobacterium kubicae]|uniref:Uncharacterized protein n=1 Tax=Mycobacterium kubicae TaxID=120959 RepID=A0ABQ1BMI0_9MYCO|nr:hypothetical protein MKUB_23590 [Mycobacterium kubicae]
MCAHGINCAVTVERPSIPRLESTLEAVSALSTPNAGTLELVLLRGVQQFASVRPAAVGLPQP